MPSPRSFRLFRTTAFKLSAIFLTVFAIFAVFLIGTIAGNMNAILETQTGTAVDAELRAIALQYETGGAPWLARVIDLRSRQPGASLYFVTNESGEKIAGNIEAVPEEILDQTDSVAQVVPYTSRDEKGSQAHTALVRVAELPDGIRVLVGRDLSERQELVRVVQQSLILTVGLMLVLGLAAWLFVSRRVLKRIDSIAETSNRFVAGDLSGRLEVTGTGDEFDRLAESLNTMLTRIERLMLGLKQVSDNIAHDLKTPLTRMRNRVERALLQKGSEPELRDALHATIDEADQLIRTFNALLLIARAEAGVPASEFADFDAQRVAHDVLELYEPVAEEAHVKLQLQSNGAVKVHAHRELVSQALANLVDNAIKYAGEGSASPPEVAIAVSQDRGMVTFRVADNGGGILESDRTRVTERFVRLEESRSKPGAGLGLSLVSAVAQLHGGTFVLADNKPGLEAILTVPGVASGRAG